MLRLLPFLLLTAIAVEIASIILVGGALGVVPTLLLLFAGGIVGISLIRSAGTNIAQTLRAPRLAASVHRELAGETLIRVLAGLLLLIPGFASDLAALLLFLPPLRRRIQAWAAPRDGKSAPFRDGRYAVVIDAEAVEISGGIEPPPPGGGVS